MCRFLKHGESLKTVNRSSLEIVGPKNRLTIDFTLLPTRADLPMPTQIVDHCTNCSWLEGKHCASLIRLRYHTHSFVVCKLLNHLERSLWFSYGNTLMKFIIRTSKFERSNIKHHCIMYNV